MAQAKQKHPEAKKDNPTGSKKDAETIAREARSSVRKQEEYVSNRVDQLGSIISKGFDLAETGISLGVNLLNRLGTVVGDRIVNVNSSPGNAGNTYAEPQGASPNQPPDAAGGGAPMYQNMQDVPEPVREVDSPPASIVRPCPRASAAVRFPIPVGELHHPFLARHDGLVVEVFLRSVHFKRARLSTADHLGRMKRR